MVLMRPAIGVALVAIMSCRLFSATIFESASLGQTGFSRDELISLGIPALNVHAQVFTGVRFELSQPTQVTRIGGHFIVDGVAGAGSVFGALIALEDDSDFPDSSVLSTPDVLGSTLIPLPSLSDNVSGELPLTLQPGWYSVVYGSGLFGADGSGDLLRNGIDIGNPTYVDGQPGSIDFWRETPAFFTGQRFFVEGFTIPEPSTIFLAILGLMAMMSRRSPVMSL